MEGSVVMNSINIAADFTTAPGARYRKQGEYSGEEFREKYLEPLFRDKKPSEYPDVEIELNGLLGYPASFLEEAFGGIARIIGKEEVAKHFTYRCDEVPEVVDKIKRYVEYSSGKRRN